MKIAIDTHTHSTASGHAYSSIDDLARGARKRGLKGFVLTDHGPALPGGTHPYHFGNLRILPPKIKGVYFFKGVEANILDVEGGIDLSPGHLKTLDFVMAGFHEACFKSRGREENTRALLAVLANPYVDAISHPGNPAYPINIEEVVRAALQYGKALEINNSSFKVRPGSEENCRTLARLCAEHGVLLSCGSDAHYWEDVGNFSKARSLLQEAGVSPSQVINSSLRSFLDFSETRRALRMRE
jgi:putative hydrolase